MTRHPMAGSARVRDDRSGALRWAALLAGVALLVVACWALAGWLRTLDPDSLGVTTVTLLVLGGIALAVFVYFLPWSIARHHKRRQRVAIGVLNLFLGWTLIGWIAALVWALVEDR